MARRDMALAALVSVVWGLAFVAIQYGLESFSAPQLTVLRFGVAALPVLVLPRPPVAWRLLVLVGLTLFTGQFLLIFFAYSHGMPPGVASVTQQLQAFFTVLLAAVFLRELPTRRQVVGIAVAFSGIGLIAATVGGDLRALGLGLALAAALSWGVGNVLVKWVGPVPVFPFVAWLSLIPPLPALLVSILDGSERSLPEAIGDASWVSIGAVLYLGIGATMLAYAIWGGLLARYPAAMVTPFALLAPCVGVVASAVAFDERFRPTRYAGMALILAGLAVIVLPVSWTARLRRQSSRRVADLARSDEVLRGG